MPSRCLLGVILRDESPMVVGGGCGTDEGEGQLMPESAGMALHHPAGP